MKSNKNKAIISMFGAGVLLLALLFNLQLSTGASTINSNSFSLQNVEAFADTGTCCIQLDSYCVIGDIERVDKYYIKEGPCPEY